jgi:hypothetical protein
VKALICFVVFVFFAFPAFSQAANLQRFRALSDAMGTTLTRSTAALADFDSRTGESRDVQRYAHYFRQHRFLATALQESERQLNFLLRGHAHPTLIDEEHRNFRNLLRAMEALKTEYDGWLRTVQ